MRGMFLAAVALGGSVVACAMEVPLEERRSRSSHQFFENSADSRRDASLVEASRVARLSVGCASFFLQNTASQTLMVTAQHCTDYDITSWCAGDGARAGAIVDNDGKRGRCVRVVATDPAHDIAVFETDLVHARSRGSSLRLASYVPAPDTRLVMVGYPADEDPTTARRGKLTTTGNCWTLGTAVESPQSGRGLLDESLRHNCTTYGGNSGGPMWIEGTSDVVGLPFTYMPDDYTRRSATDLETAAHLALTADFVGVHRAELEAAGVIISDAPPTP